MKIAILTYRQYPYVSANTAIAYEIGGCLSNELGCEVVYIGRKQDRAQDSVCSYQGSKICFLNKSVPNKHVERGKAVARKYFGEGIGWGADASELKRIIKREKIEALICVIAPLEDARILKKANLSIPCVLYQLDPFYHFEDRVDVKKKKEFIKILKGIDSLVTTRLLMAEYAQDAELLPYLNKFFVAEFPLLKPLAKQGEVRSNDNPILLYSGSLYGKIRSPKILVNLRKALPKHYRVVFCGACDSNEDYEMLKTEGIVCKGRLLPEELIKEYEAAHVLVNIGNTVKNQMGSKLISYMGIGKPILNIMQFEDCTVDVLKKYPLALNVLSSNILNDCEKIQKFIEINKGSCLDFEDVESRYIEYTPTYVAKKIITILNKRN